MNVALNLAAVCALAGTGFWIYCALSVLADRRSAASSAAVWRVSLRVTPGRVDVCVCTDSQHMSVGSVPADSDRFDDQLADLRGVAEERACALNAFDPADGRRPRFR